jgi:hypothetical protein
VTKHPTGTAFYNSVTTVLICDLLGWCGFCWDARAMRPFLFVRSPIEKDFHGSGTQFVPSVSTIRPKRDLAPAGDVFKEGFFLKRQGIRKRKFRADRQPVLSPRTASFDLLYSEFVIIQIMSRSGKMKEQPTAVLIESCQH